MESNKETDTSKYSSSDERLECETTCGETTWKLQNTLLGRGVISIIQYTCLRSTDKSTTSEK